MLRDISGASFGESAATPHPPELPPKRAASVAKSAASGKNRDASAASQAGTGDNQMQKRARSVNRTNMRSVNDVFSDKQNRAKFCMPLTLPSAREIEVLLNKQKELKEEMRKKKKA